MLTTYTWDSPKKSDEVVKIISSLTERKSRIERFASSNKRLENNDTQFSIWFDGHSNEPTYNAPTLKGIIKDVPSGCTVLARAQIIGAYISNSFVIGMIILFFTMGMAALYADFTGAIPVSIICILISIASSLWFRYTFKKYRNMQVQLEIMKVATGVNCQIEVC